MDINRLRRRGWSEQEIGHLKALLERAEARKHPRMRLMEHACLWLVIAALISGAIAAAVELLPVLLLSRSSVPLLFLIGTCYGLLLVHVLHDLRLERRHQHLGVGVLVMSSVIAIALVLAAFEARLGALQAGGAVFAAIVFSLGILIPYLVHWRVTHASA